MDCITRHFPIFKTGIHRDSEGRERTWTGADLDHIVASYDPALHEAPVVIGHPRENAPAYGWVKGLSREGGILFADADLVPEFDEMVRKGLFKKRSISLYEDGTLRHIGFLGAVPPAIKGLPDIRFGEGEATTIEIITPDRDSKNEQGGRTMKFVEWIRQLAGKEGVTLEDFPGERQVEVKVKVEEERKRLEREFAEAGKAREDNLRAREEKMAAREREARKAGITAFCEALAKEGKLTPAMMKVGMGMTNFLESIAAIETPIEFGEADGKSKQTPLEFMQAFLKGLPKAIEFGEVATPDKDPGGGGDKEKRDRLIGTYMEQHPGAAYREAVLSVSKDNPELFVERP